MWQYQVVLATRQHWDLRQKHMGSTKVKHLPCIHFQYWHLLDVSKLCWNRFSTISDSAYYMAATWYIEPSGCGEDDLSKFKSSIRMRKKELIYFKQRIVVGARQVVLWVIQKTAIILGLSCKPSHRFKENGLNRENSNVSSSNVKENTLLMSEVNGEKGDWFEMIEMY